MSTVTIIKCDHCGNKITKANQYMFGPASRYDDDDEDEDEVPRRKRALQSTQQVVRKITIDLCNSCVPVWMERVRKITEASDP